VADGPRGDDMAPQEGSIDGERILKALPQGELIIVSRPETTLRVCAMSAGPNKHALDMALQAKEGGGSPDWRHEKT
jgi:hypothetical protein